MKVAQLHDGVRIISQSFEIHICPVVSGRLLVEPVAVDDRFGYVPIMDSKREFLSSEIHILDDRVECFAVNESYPRLREGFIFDLEEGMAALMRIWIPELKKIAGAAKKTADIFEKIKKEDHSIDHLLGAITSVAKAIVLEHADSKEAISQCHEDLRWHRGGEFFKLFDDNGVQDILHSLENDRISEALRSGLFEELLRC